MSIIGSNGLDDHLRVVHSGGTYPVSLYRRRKYYHQCDEHWRALYGPFGCPSSYYYYFNI